VSERWLGAAVLAVAFLGAEAAHPADKAAVEKAYKDAAEKPGDAAALQALQAVLPRFGDDYIVEGDRRLTESQLRAYVASLSSAAQPASPDSGELLVHVSNGKPELWCQAARDLTYAVDRRSFGSAAQYEAVVTTMAKAAQEWTAACPSCKLTFTHLREHDAEPSHQKVIFVVKQADPSAAFIALAFFPSDAPARRFLYVAAAFFTTDFDRVGILRHELGHVLGYRHEHIQGVPGCYREDANWIALGPYNPKSVMHYPCGGGGSLSFALGARDRTDHAAWYGKPDGGVTCSSGSVTRNTGN
jgi:hypothetical protein